MQIFIEKFFTDNKYDWSFLIFYIFLYNDQIFFILNVKNLFT
jgi:hypothetical protein